MKRLIFLLIILLTLSGCAQKETYKKPVKLYYPQAKITYGSKTGSVTFETRESFGQSNEAILQSYLEGPLSDNVSQPFPAGVSLTLLKVADNQASIVLTDGYAALSGLNLSIANVCLSKTVMELCNVDTVTIQCESEALGGSPSIIIDSHELLIFDESIGPNGSLQTTETSTSE